MLSVCRHWLVGVLLHPAWSAELVPKPRALLRMTCGRRRGTPPGIATMAGTQMVWAVRTAWQLGPSSVLRSYLGLWLPPDPFFSCMNAVSGHCERGCVVRSPPDDKVTLCSPEPCGCLWSAERTLLSLSWAGLQVKVLRVVLVAGAVLWQPGCRKFSVRRQSNTPIA